MALADYMLSNDTAYLTKIKEVDAWLLEQNKPDIFDDGDARNVVSVARINFIKVCAVLTEQGFSSPEKMTLVAFHGAIDYLSAKHKPE